jgi:hypothetical protein
MRDLLMLGHDAVGDVAAPRKNVQRTAGKLPPEVRRVDAAPRRSSRPNVRVGAGRRA